MTDPGRHVAHSVVEMAENWPALHSVQVEAPVLASLSVTDPGRHIAHASVEVAENWPALH